MRSERRFFLIKIRFARSQVNKHKERTRSAALARPTTIQNTNGLSFLVTVLASTREVERENIFVHTKHKATARKSQKQFSIFLPPNYLSFSLSLSELRCFISKFAGKAVLWRFASCLSAQATKATPIQLFRLLFSSLHFFALCGRTFFFVLAESKIQS